MFVKSVNRVIQVRQGKIEGVPAGNPSYTVFRGVPFAAAPVGNDRFRPARDPEPWEGVRRCDRFAPIGIQHRWNEGDFYQKEFYPDSPDMSEDSLYCNIWTPDTTGEKRLPVLVWIHGGANMHGFSYEMEFDGEAICKRGCVLVSIAYRLGALGWLAHPALAERAGISGNWALTDCVQALRWVRENAPAFGGDPERVTIFGQSAGGGIVKALLSMPDAKGLFSGAIIQSAGGLGFTGRYRTREMLEDAAVHACESLGLTPDDLLHMDATRLTTSLAEAHAKAVGAGLPFGPCVDGKILPVSPEECLREGKWPDARVMIGCVAGDDMLFGREGSSAREQVALFAENAVRVGRKDVWAYYFDRMMPGDEAGAFHSAELWYVFGTLDRCWRPFVPGDWALSQAMTDYWCAFAKGGAVTVAGQEEWTSYSAASPMLMRFNETTIGLEKA